MKNQKKTEAKKIKRTTEGLRSALFDELDGLRNGKVNPARANAVSRSAIAIVGTVRLEMDYQKLMLSLAKTGRRALKPVTLLLGPDSTL